MLTNFLRKTPILSIPMLVGCFINLISIGFSLAASEAEAENHKFSGQWRLVEVTSWKEVPGLAPTEKNRTVFDETKTFFIIREVNETTFQANTIASRNEEKNCYGRNVSMWIMTEPDVYRNALGVTSSLAANDTQLKVTTRHSVSGVVRERIYVRENSSTVENKLAEICKNRWSPDDAVFGFWKSTSLTSSGNGVKRDVDNFITSITGLFEDSVLFKKYIRQGDCYIISEYALTLDNRNVYVSPQQRILRN